MIKAVVFDYDWVLVRYYFRSQREMFDFSESLRAKGIKTAVLSNRFFPLTWLTRLNKRLRAFDLVIFTHHANASKPDPKSYEFVIKKLGLRPEECLFVDNRVDNITGAEAMGMPVVWAKSTAQTIATIKTILAL